MIFTRFRSRRKSFRNPKGEKRERMAGARKKKTIIQLQGITRRRKKKREIGSKTGIIS
jgi:hypothetical protein